MENKKEMNLKELAKEIHSGNVKRGFWDNPREKGTILMLCVSELAEALEADRKERFADVAGFDNWLGEEEMMEGVIDEKLFKDVFERKIKDSFEDEIADTMIRLLDLSAAYGIDIDKHINLKLKYNDTRERMHGKKY